MTHHDGTDHDHNHADHDHADHDHADHAHTEHEVVPGEAADFVHAVDHGDGTDEELTDGLDKGDFTTSVDLGDGETAVPNSTRGDGDYISASTDTVSPEGDDYVDPVDHG